MRRRSVALLMPGVWLRLAAALLVLSGSGCASDDGAGQLALERGRQQPCMPGPEGLRQESLASYCSARSCPTYDSIFETQPAECVINSVWVLTVQEGCGQVIFTSSSWLGLGETMLVFDAVSHELIGLRSTTDVGDECGNFGVLAGVAPSCDQGNLCLRCGSQDECVEACSIAALKTRPHPGDYDTALDELSLRSCVDLPVDQHARLATGCGRVSWRDASGAVIFDQQSRQILGWHRATSGACGGHWGDPAQPCPEEVSCSLCQEDADRCDL